MPREAPLVAAALGDTAWVTFPGELQTALGQTIKREARAPFATVFVAGLSNDYLGYFTTREDVRRAKYVACATVYGPTAGGCLTDAAIDLLRELRREPRPAARTSTTCDAGPDSR
jgi:neutral ceramidase